MSPKPKGHDIANDGSADEVELRVLVGPGDYTYLRLLVGTVDAVSIDQIPEIPHRESVLACLRAGPIV